MKMQQAYIFWDKSHYAPIDAVLKQCNHSKIPAGILIFVPGIGIFQAFFGKEFKIMVKVCMFFL